MTELVFYLLLIAVGVVVFGRKPPMARFVKRPGGSPPEPFNEEQCDDLDPYSD
jgi:hypothetical protein